MKLIPAGQADFSDICALYEATVSAMRAGGLDQWTWGEYPAPDIIADDIEKGEMYIAHEDGCLVCAVCINCVQDDEYAAFNWHYGVHPGLFHRLAISPHAQGKGYGRAALNEVCRILRDMGCDALRCDTYSHNAAALRLYDRFGMRRAEIFYFPWKTDPFVPFEMPLTADCPVLPIRMQPAFRAGSATPWGGDRLEKVYHKHTPGAPTGESLEVSCIAGLESRDMTGTPLTDLIARYGARLVGRYAGREFPLLLKLLDAQETLSVQVHPNDAYAAAHAGKQGKTEAWLILEAPENAELVYGVHAGVTKEQLREACTQGGAVSPLLRRVKVRPGDVCYIPAGCVHAIGSGILLYEIQQSSDVTYRFYDWDRRDAAGHLRPLHIEDALEVTDLSCQPEVIRCEAQPCPRVLSTPYFDLDIYHINGSAVLPQPDDFAVLTALTDGVSLHFGAASLKLCKGETVLIPAAAPQITLKGTGTAAAASPA